MEKFILKTDGIGVYQARSILTAYDVYGTEYLNPCEMSEENNLRIINNNADKEISFNLYPNPSDGNIILEYEIEQNSELIINDVAGKEICRYDLLKENQQVNINCEELSSGVYLYTISTKSIIINSGKIVIIK